MNVAILGAGNIAEAMAQALNGLDESVCAYAVASRNLEKAEAFAKKWNMKKAYGSYEELVSDEKVDLIYVATPHAMHYEHAKLCLEHGKPALVEKSFTANAKQAAELIALSEQKNVFLTEAIWTRYLPSRQMVADLLEQGVIGEPTSMKAEFSIPISHINRMQNPALAGGALLDLGMYTLTVASMFFGDELEHIESRCKKYKTGVDATDHITLYYKDGKVANLKTSMVSLPKNQAIIYGTKGSLRMPEINNFKKICVYDEKKKLQDTIFPPKQINGYEYEVLACKRALEEGKIECEEMPHAETLKIMEWMDSLRKEWGVVYPFETVV